jgi:hypothetical protein
VSIHEISMATALGHVALDGGCVPGYDAARLEILVFRLLPRSFVRAVATFLGRRPFARDNGGTLTGIDAATEGRELPSPSLMSTTLTEQA